MHHARGTQCTEWLFAAFDSWLSKDVPFLCRLLSLIAVIQRDPTPESDVPWERAPTPSAQHSPEPGEPRPRHSPRA